MKILHDLTIVQLFETTKIIHNPVFNSKPILTSPSTFSLNIPIQLILDFSLQICNVFRLLLHDLKQSFSDLQLRCDQITRTFCNLSLSFFLAALKDGGSCSSSKSTVINSSNVNALVGVSPNSTNLQ